MSQSTFYRACYLGDYAAARKYLNEKRGTIHTRGEAEISIDANTKKTFHSPLDAALDGVCNPQVVALLLEEGFGDCVSLSSLELILRNKTATSAEWLCQSLILLTDAGLTLDSLYDTSDAFSEILFKAEHGDHDLNVSGLAIGIILAAAMTSNTLFTAKDNDRITKFLKNADQIWADRLYNFYSVIDIKPYASMIKQNFQILSMKQIIDYTRRDTLEKSLSALLTTQETKAPTTRSAADKNLALQHQQLMAKMTEILKQNQILMAELKEVAKKANTTTEKATNSATMFANRMQG